MPRIPTIDFANVREFYERQIGGHWFDQSTMRFFKTKLPRVAYATDAGLLFITAETSPSGDTRYSVRRQKVSGDIDTVGEFHSFRSRADALVEIKRLHGVHGKAV